MSNEQKYQEDCEVAAFTEEVVKVTCGAVFFIFYFVLPVIVLLGMLLGWR